MNNIFYWLWLADCVDSVRIITAAITVFYCAVLAAACIMFVCSCEETDISTHVEITLNSMRKMKRVLMAFLCPLFLSVFVLIALPSKTAILASLGASVTEDMMQNPITQKALQVLDKKLDTLLQDKETKND